MKTSVASVSAEKFAVGFFSIVGAQAPAELSERPSVESLLKIGRALFPGDNAMALSFVRRFVGLLGVLRRAELERWVRDGAGDAFHVHPALLGAAAELKMNRNGKFPLRLLVDRAVALEAGAYRDWEWPEVAS